jgi:hypothetical protein
MSENVLNSSLVSIQGFVVGDDLWFEPRHGLNVLYGKNGVGKSTVINFIEAICNNSVVMSGWDTDDTQRKSIERSARSEAERGSGRVIVSFLAPLLVDAADALAHTVRFPGDSIERRPKQRRRWSIPQHESKRVAELLVRQKNKKNRWTDERVFQGIAALADKNTEEVQASIELLSDGFSDGEDSLMSLLFLLTKKILQHEFNPEPVRIISDALRSTIRFHYTEWAPESAFIVDINNRLSFYGIDQSLEVDDVSLNNSNLNELDFANLYLLFVDVIICRLEYELKEKVVDIDLYYGDTYRRLSEFNDDNPLTFSKVRTDADDIIGVVVRAVFEQRKSPLVSIDRHSGPGNSRNVHLLFKTFDADGVGESTVSLESLRLAWKETGEQDTKSFEEQVCCAWLLDSSVLNSERLGVGTHQEEQLPFYELQFPIGKVEDAPFEIFRLDDNLDLDQVVTDVAATTVGRELFEALAILEDDELDRDELLKFVEPLNNIFKPVSDFVALLGIGVEGIEAEMSSNVGDWLSGRGIQLNFHTSSRRVSFVQLSTAQQFWIKASMKLIAAQKSNSRVLVIADEPDRSLHERASYNVMEALTTTGLDVVVSSHSVAALRTRNATLHHLEIGPQSVRTISEVTVGDDVLVASERLGTTPYDLLSLKRMMILVEGAHDAAVVNKLIGLSENRLLSDRILVAPMRGVRNVVSAADSVLVTEFSELNLLIVVDNGRNEVFKPILDELRERDSLGASDKELKQILTLHRANSEASYEERMLFDLLERAIHRGILRRLDLFALSVGDVVELLPAEGFGSTVGWAELRLEYQLSGLRTDFKSWLRETHQISVSVRSVERAFDGYDSLHPELTRLLQQIELGCSL